MIIIGFILLVVGADLLIKGSSNIAKKFNIPEILIGLTIVALGTSLPELIITIFSAAQNSSDLIIGNVAGSNLCNLLLVMGLTAFLKPIEIDEETKKIHLPVALFSSIAILGLGLGILGTSNNIITRIDGIVLVLSYLIYFIYPIVIEVNNIKKVIKEDNKIIVKDKNILISIILIILGIIALKFGGDIVVKEATQIAIKYKISESVIGLTLVALGTSLPELITSIVAIIKKEEELAVGNLVGSCVLNSLLILGIGAIITPLIFTKELIFNLVLLIITIMLILIFCMIGKKNTITRFESLLLLLMYTIYIGNLFK